MKYGYCIACLLLLSVSVYGQQIIEGVVQMGGSSRPLAGITVTVKGTTQQTSTASNGTFRIETTVALPLTLVISDSTFHEQEVVVTKNEYQTITLKKSVLLKEARLRGSRISEKIKESPLTIESLDIIGIRETPAANFYEGLGQLKAVDLISGSIAFKVLNTRGFSSTSPVRSLQLIDGVDNQSPGLNFSLGNFLGAPELDMQRVELVVGASSAYYGPNAFNGVIVMTSRSPFVKPGLEVSARVAERSMFEGNVRWAQVLKNKKGEEKFGYKLNLSFMRANDWEADNTAATPQSRNDEHNPGGYDAVNVYGDEFITGSDYNQAPGAFPGLGAFYRRGYHEKDIVDYKTYNVKANTALHYKVRQNTELILASSFCTGTTIYRGDNPVLLKDVMFFQNRIEVRHQDKWFFRAYATNEDAGNTYDIYTTGLLLQQEAKSDGYFKTDYENYWNAHYNLNYVRTLPGFPQPPGPGAAYVDWLASINPYLYAHYYDSVLAWHHAAQAYANGIGSPGNHAQPFFEPGTSSFDTAFAGITSRNIGQGGSRYFDRSSLYHAQGEYHFSPAFCNIVTGANFRMYTPNSQGTVFSDTNGHRIRNSEFGLYAGAEKRLLGDKLKVNLTARLDKNQNFPFLFSPAASLVYQPRKDQYLCLSFSSAIRNPTLQDQYLYLFVGRALLAGNTKGFSQLVTIPSLQKTFDVNKVFDSLVYFDIAAVKPEKVKTLEAGYRATLISRLYIDLSAYYSWYKDFIGYKIGVDIDTSKVNIGGVMYPKIDVNNVYRAATNSTDGVSTMGATIGANYYIGRYLAVTANYSWNSLDRHGSTDPLIPAFNTPEHKYNVGVNGRGFHDFSFNINYKWVSGFVFEGSPQFTGSIASYNMLDLQVSRNFPRQHTIIKVGASNILNNEHYEVYGGPLVGRLAYICVTFAPHP